MRHAGSSGVVVEDFPAHACRLMLRNFEAASRLSPAVPLRQLLPAESSSQDDVNKHLDVLLDLQRTNLSTSDQDLRVLLVKELRHILSYEKQPIKKLALFRKTEATARLKLTTKFIQRLISLGSLYERELLQQLEAGGKETRRTITKLFVTNTAEQVEEWLGAPTFFSPHLQTLLCLVMQVEPKDLTMSRGMLEIVFSQYMLDPLVDRRHLMHAVFAHISSDTLFFTDKEKKLILDFLELAWEVYYSHSAQILEALKMQDKTHSALDWLREKLLNARDAIISLNRRQVLDRYGFLSASYLLRWVGSKSLPRLSLLLPNCRLAHVTGSTPVTFASTGDFALAVEFEGLVGTVERVDERLFYLVVNSFNSQDFSALQKYRLSSAEPTFKIEVLQLTPTTAQSLRQPLTTHGGSSKDLKGLLSKPELHHLHHRRNACLSIFNWLFTGGASELRTLLNMELATIYTRMRRDMHLSVDQNLQDLFVHWFNSVEVEKEAVLTELQQQMDEATRDPNFVIESFFFNSELATKLITTPTYTTLGNTAAISAMAAVVQLKTLAWAVNLTPESLKQVQLLVVSNPSLRLTHQLALKKGIVTPAGKQKLLRRDLVERVTVILEITARLQYRFFDNLAALLPTQLRDGLKNMLCGRRRPSTPTESPGGDTTGSLEKLFDRTGFYSAFQLMIVAHSVGVTVNLIGKNSRAITIGKADDKAAPITVLEDPESGEFRRVTNGGRVMVPSGMTLVTWFELPGVRLTNAVLSTFPSTAFHVLKQLIQQKGETFDPLSPPIVDKLTEEAALKVEKFAKARTLQQASRACTPTSPKFVGCMMMQLLRCKEYDAKCRSTLENAEKFNAELWEGVLLELNSPRTEGLQLFTRHPWNKLERVIKDISKANRAQLSFEEREVLLGGFLTEGMRQSPPTMHGIHLLRMRSILFKIPSSDPGVACLNSVLSGAEVMLSEPCFKHLEKTFAPFLLTSVDNTTPETIAAEVKRLYYMDFSSLYDFVISPLKDTFSSADEKQALGACLYVMGRRIEHDDEIYSQAPGVVPRSGSPSSVKNCLLEVWHKYSRRPTFLTSDVANSGAKGQPASGWDAFVTGVQKRHLVSPAVEAFHRAAFSDVFLHILIQHRLLALMDALALFRRAISSKENPETGSEPSRLVASMRALTTEEFMQLMFTSEELIPFSLALVSQITGKDIYFLYFLRASGSASFFRIGHKSRPRITSFIKKWHRHNLICTPSCVEVSPSVDMEAVKKRKVARTLSHMLHGQVEAFKSVTRSVSILNTSRASDLSASFQNLENPEMQTENVSPGSIDICSQQMTARGGSVLPVCHYESVPYRYAHEAFRLTLAQRAVPPRTWFQFFSMNYETVLNDCISEAKRLTKKQTLEDFTKLTEWRRFLPVALSNAVKMLLAGFADIKKLLRLIEGRIASRKDGRLGALAQSLVKWLVKPKKPRAVPQYKAEDLRRDAAIDVIEVISLGELRNLPKDVILTSWRDYSLPLDSSDPAGMQYDKTRRLLIAIGAGFKCAQMFSSAQRVFFGAMKGNKEAEEFVQKLASEFFLSAGSPRESFRAIKLEATRSIATFCHGRRNKSDCVLNLVDELITSPSPMVSTEVVFKSLAPVLSKLSYSISIWNQLTGTLTRFTQNQASLSENIPIQLIVGSRSELEESVPPRESSNVPSTSGAHSMRSRAPSTASSFVGLGSEEEVYYSATDSPEPPSASTDMEDTVVLLVSPGFDLYERLMEARRSSHTKCATFCFFSLCSSGSFFQLERRLLEMQEQVSRLSPRQSMAAKSLGEMQSMIDELSFRDDLTSSNILDDSKLFSALGPNVANQEFFSQQKHTIDTLWAEGVEPLSKLDWYLQQSLTGFQLFVACKDIPEECNAFRVEFLNRVKETLTMAKAKGEAMLRIGQQQRSHIMSMEKIQKAIGQIEATVMKIPPCLTEACKEDADALPKLLKPVRRLMGAPKFRELMKEVMEKPAKDMEATVPFEAFRLASHLTYPHLSMQQWIEVLFHLRQSEGVISAGPNVARSIMSIVGTCVEIARRRLKDALHVIQKSLQQMSERIPRVVQTPFRTLTLVRAAVRSVLDDCCRETNFKEHGATFLTHELIARLRARRYTISAGVDLGPLMDNRQSYSAWIQQAVTTQVEQADAVLLMMISVCKEGSFYTQGAAACTRKLLQAFESKNLKLDTLTSINTNKLSLKSLTYHEWLQNSGQLHVISSIATVSQALRSSSLARQHEAQAWTAIAEILYRAPDTSWKVVQKKLKEQVATEKALSCLGLQAVKKLYSAVRTLHQAVGLVEEADFKRFGAFAITNLLVDHLKDKGVYVAGNSAVTLRTIRQAKTFREWLQDIVLLKVSKELVKPPVPAILVSEVQSRRLGAFIFRRLARSQLVSNIIRSLVNKSVGLVTPLVIRRSMSRLRASEPAKAGTVGQALLTLAVLANCYLNLDFVVLTSILPMVLGVMESHDTRSILESVLVKADIPQILGRTVLSFSAEIEDTILDVVTSNYLEPGALNDIVLRATGVNLRLQELNLASSFSRVAAYLQEIIRREAPVIPAGLYMPCGTSPSRLRRAFGAAATWLTGMAYGKESKCFRKVQYLRDAGGEVLNISWIEDGELQSIKLPVQALGQPGADIPQKDRSEAVVDRQTIRVIERVLNAEAAEAGSVAFPALRWLISTYIAGRSILSGALRRERTLFETASLEQGEVRKLASKEQESLAMHFFRRARTSTDPAWRLRVAALLNQAKYKELHSSLGSRREEFVEALAKAYTTWVDRLQAESAESTAGVVSAQQLEAMCPDKSRLEDCERNYGVWGSLYFQEADLALARSIGSKRMESPYLFKYWRINQDAAAASLAVADFEALERYKHDMRRTHNVEVVGGLQASISILLGKYTQALRAEESGMDIRSDHKFQLLKYLHMQMREVLKEAKNPKEPNTTAILASNLRAAGYDVLVRIPLHLGCTATEAKEKFGILEGLADLFYRDLQLPTRSIHLRSLYGLQINLYGSKVHLLFASRMMRSNPLASHGGFQLTRKNESIRESCKTNFCPHTAVMWNHVYVMLLVLMQLAESPDVVSELLVADSFSEITGFGLGEIPVTFEESFIAFKAGLDYLQQMEEKVPPNTFFSHRLSSETITSLLTAFANFDRDFAVLLLHTPPPESAAALSSNNRAALQQATWNAFIALWSFHEVFGRLGVDVLTSLEALPSFAPSATSNIRGGRGFWMPQCVTDPLRAQLAVLFEPLPGRLARLPAVLRAVDSALQELRPKIRKNGYISHTDPEILALWWQIMAIAFKNNPGMELETEAFSRSPQKTQKFCEIIQQAATIAGFVSQLKMADTKSVLVRRARRFGFESWTTLVESFYTARPPPQEVRESLERIFHLACRMIPANSETQSIKILGKETEDVNLFRTLVDAVTLRLMQLGQDVPATMTHYPICRAIRVVTCEGLDLSESVLSKSCQELDVVRQRVLSKIDFSPKFCEAMRKAEEPLVERSECGENERNHVLLKRFFLEYMTEQLESSAIKSQWSKIQEAQMLKYRNPNLYPLAENALASMIHEAGIRLAEVESNAPEFLNQVQQAAKEVYSTMCNFVDYASASLELKDSNVCRLMLQPPAPLIQTLSDMLQAHITRIQLGRFSSTMQPVATLTLQQIVNSDSLPQHPAGALTVGIFRFVESYFTKGKTSEQSTEGGSAYQRVRKGLANTISLILDKLYKLKSRFAEWNQKMIRSLRLLINYIVRLVLRSAKQMSYLGKKTLAMQQAEERIQSSMRRRLQQQQKAREPDSMSGDTSTTASEDSASFVDVEAGSKIRKTFPGDTSPLLASSLSRDISLVQTGLLTKPDPKQGQGLLGIVRLMASMLLCDLPRSISDIVAHILPSVWNSISGVLRVKKSVVGSVKDTAEKVCVRVMDSTVLPSLISTNSLVPAGLIKTQMSLLARNIHFSVMPEASTVERDLKAARRKSGFLGMLALIRGLVFVVAGQLEDLLQSAEFQDRIVKIIHRRVRELAGVIQAAFKRYLISEVVCESVEVVIDLIADVLSEKRDDFVHSVLEIIELDALGRLSVFIESQVWRLIKLLLDGKGALDLMKGIIGQVGFLGAAKDTESGNTLALSCSALMMFYDFFLYSCGQLGEAWNRQFKLRIDSGVLEFLRDLNSNFLEHRLFMSPLTPFLCGSPPDLLGTSASNSYEATMQVSTGGTSKTFFNLSYRLVGAATPLISIVLAIALRRMKYDHLT
ncbi:hypothetical protein Esti_002671 [Eimeria stiedai]